MPKRRQIITAGGPKLQEPTLPVKVTSGKLGPGAAYAAQNWGFDDPTGNGQADGADIFFRAKAIDAYTPVGATVFLAGGYNSSDYNASLSYDQYQGTGHVLWEVFKKTGVMVGYLASIQIDSFSSGSFEFRITAGPSSSHAWFSCPMGNLSEFY